MAKRSKKEKPPKVDGLGPDDLKKIHKAVRQVWMWSYPRRQAVARAMDAKGFPKCERCGKRSPKVSIDHIDPVGEIGGPDYIARMWCPSDRLQGLCKACHAPKTKREGKARAVGRRKTKAVKIDFY